MELDAGTEDTGRSASHAHATTGPKRVGPYVVEGVLGAGGMGSVYRAYDPRLHRAVAIKCMRTRDGDPRTRARFWREARALAALGHPGVVRVYDVGEDPEHDLYIAMELVEGRALAPHPDHPWSVAATLTLGIMVARALGAAHAADIVHRDVKPSNVMVGPDGQARLIDFGLAARAEIEAPLTAEHTLLGTIAYLAPEQVRGQVVTPATDVHAVGLLLYALLTGAPPHQRESRDASIAALLAGEHTPLSARRADVPPALAAVLERCLAPIPSARYPDGDALADALERAARDAGVAPSAASLRQELEAMARAGAPGGWRATTTHHRRRRAWVWLAAAGALVAVSGVTLAVVSADPSSPPPPDAATTTAFVDVAAARTRVAVLPFADELLSDVTAPRVSDVVRDMLLPVHEGLVVATWEELFARALALGAAADDRALERLQARSLLDAPASAAFDVIVSGRVERGAEPAVVLELVAADRRRAEVRVPGGDDVFATAERVVAALLPRLGLGAVPGRTAPTRSRGAWSAYMAARRAWHLGWERTARRHINTTAEADPAFTAGHVLRARIWDDAGLRDDARLGLALAEQQAPEDARLRGAVHLFREGWRAGSKLAHAYDKHLERWPSDLRARLDRLRRSFVGLDGGSLGDSAEAARELLLSAPGTPIAASRLVRALAWRGEGARARTLLEGLGLGPETPGMASVFAELALYDGDFAAARELFGAAREPDGDLTSYAEHMQVAAVMLAGDCRAAAATLTSMIERARHAESLGDVEWTYLMLINALVCDGATGAAREAMGRWRARLGGETASAEQHLTWALEIDLLTLPREDVSARIRGALRGGGMAETYLRLEYLRAFVVLAAEPGEVEAWLSWIDGVLHGALDVLSANDIVVFERTRQGLLARLAIAEGAPDRAIGILEELTRRDRWVVRSEGDIFSRTRWLRARAEVLDEIGEKDAAEAVWREILDIGYGRLLVMDATLAARRRLGLTPAGEPLP